MAVSGWVAYCGDLDSGSGSGSMRLVSNITWQLVFETGSTLLILSVVNRNIAVQSKGMPTPLMVGKASQPVVNH